VHHSRQFCTVVHVHLLGRYVEPSGACVYRYGPVTKSKLFYHDTKRKDLYSRPSYRSLGLICHYEAESTACMCMHAINFFF
jgi:hypothetical protein